MNAIALYHTCSENARKIPPAEARGIFPKGCDGKPSECLSLFAVLMLHRDRIFAAFVVRSGIVTVRAYKCKLSPHAGLAPDYSPLLMNEPLFSIMPTSTLFAPPA